MSVLSIEDRLRIDYECRIDEKVTEYIKRAAEILFDTMDDELESDLLNKNFAEYNLIITNIAAMIQKEELKK